MQAKTHTNIIEGNWNAVKRTITFRYRTSKLVKIFFKWKWERI